MTNEMTAEEAIKALNTFKWVTYEQMVGLDYARKLIEQQPCIEDYPTCTECEHYDKEKHYCPRFCQVIKDTLAEAQPHDCDTCKYGVHGDERCSSCCHVYADRWEADKEALDCFEQTNTRQGAKYAIETLPSVKPERPKGKWIKVYPLGMDYEAYMCSECKTGDWDITVGEYKFCPYCGAEMSGGGEDETDN